MPATVEDAWGAYRDALDETFAARAGEGLHYLVEAEAAEPAEDSMDALVQASDDLHEALVPRLAERGDVAELTALQLQAAAAVDFDSANRLAATAVDLASEGLSERIVPTAGGFLSADDLAQLERIIVTSPGDAGAILDGAPETMLAAPADKAPGDPAGLKAAVEAAIDSIVADSSAFASKTLSGLLKVPPNALLDAASKPLGAVFDEIHAKVGRILKRAAKLVWRGIQKLLSIFGTDADSVRKKVGDWINGLDAKNMEKLFTRLFSVDRLKKTLAAKIDAKGTNASNDLGAAATAVSQLAARLHKQLDVLGKVVWVLGKTQRWLVKAAFPWGLVGVTAAYVVGTGYAVDAGQDYLDWGEASVLDLVKGVKRIVEEHLDS